MNRTILVFYKGELLRQISYKTKREAKGNYRIFKKYGVLNPEDGTTYPKEDTTIELL